MRFAGSLAAMFLASAASAEEKSTSPFDLSGEVALVSDYRLRGVSWTDNDPALQGWIAASHESGAYLSAWGSLPFATGDEEIDLMAGYAFSAGGGDADISAGYYAFPALNAADYWGAIALYTHPVGQWTVRGRFEYAPPQKNLFDESVYVALETERPLGKTGVTLHLNGGWEKGAFTLDGEKWDYTVGLGYTLKGVTLSASYMGTDEDAPAGEEDVYEGGFVFSAAAAF